MAGYGKKKKKKQNRLAMLGIAVVMLLFVGVFGYQTYELQQKNEVYSERLSKIETEIEDEEIRADELEEQRIYSQTKQFIEEEAKAKLGLVNPNEIIIKPEN